MPSNKAGLQSMSVRAMQRGGTDTRIHLMVRCKHTGQWESHKCEDASMLKELLEQFAICVGADIYDEVALCPQTKLWQRPKNPDCVLPHLIKFPLYDGSPQKDKGSPSFPWRHE